MIVEFPMKLSRHKCWITETELVERTSHNRLSPDKDAHSTNMILREQVRKNHFHSVPSQPLFRGLHPGCGSLALLSSELKHAHFRELFFLSRL